jgi:hypothetical protein
MVVMKPVNNHLELPFAQTLQQGVNSKFSHQTTDDVRKRNEVTSSMQQVHLEKLIVT